MKYTPIFSITIAWILFACSYINNVSFETAGLLFLSSYFCQKEAMNVPT